MSIRSEKKQAKKTAILHAAARVFAEKGFFNATVAEIATAATVGKGTIYEYFASKEDLLFEVFTLHATDSSNACAQLLAKARGTASERLALLVNSVVENAMESIELYSLSLEFWSATSSPSLRERFQDALHDMYMTFRTLVSEQLVLGVRSGEFRSDLETVSLSHCLVGALDGLLLQAWMDRDLKAPAMARDFTHCMLHGMLADAKAQP